VGVLVYVGGVPVIVNVGVSETVYVEVSVGVPIEQSIPCTESAVGPSLHSGIPPQ